MSTVHDVTQAQLFLWDRLKTRTLIATKAYGSRAALARTLGVTRQALNAWLSGSALPTAENTLQLLQWVDAEEVKQTKSNPGNVLALPGRMTQKRKITTNEKPKSGRKSASQKQVRRTRPKHG